ncbi:T9SS type A sorting domain-containing protein [Psychroserpens burtonensis]|uniref:T9SS type A sorting domain-containing protein n=1 Tax=Psychroserpens burtonensis TaxID=49278 RepID=A0A5C7BAV4_9FLAO|nr:T9SS type A sorting domain-containing protein [Psychroserpens burtonensis]TXE19704.1 T9SS type A sorting domain-containing protein [Psychroserpens burtonensis]
MKRITLFSVVICISALSFSQDLYIGSASYITIQPDATLHIKGLGLEPAADYTLPSNTSLERLSTPAGTGNIAINRQFIVTPALDGYIGTLVFQYEDGELNGAVETELQLELYNTINSNWTPYAASIDTNANRMTYNFMSAVIFSKVTADYSETLDINSPNIAMPIKLYPNPTIDKVYIQYDHPIRTTLYNTLGQLIAKGNTHEIDLSAYEGATYFLTVEDKTTQNTYTFKIIKL